MLLRVRAANVGAVIELEAQRRRAQPVGYIAELRAENDRLRAEVEWLRSELCAMWLGLPF